VGKSRRRHHLSWFSLEKGRWSAERQRGVSYHNSYNVYGVNPDPNKQAEGKGNLNLVLIVCYSPCKKGVETMIEAAAIPILLKAVDFLFGEGSKILEERKERRLAQKQAEKTDSSTLEPIPDIPPQKAPDQIGISPIQTKVDSLQQKVDQATWVAHQVEVQHLLSLLEIYSRNYHLAKEQYAKWGTALVPPIIVNNLEEAENNAADTINKLQAALKVIYGKAIIPPGLEGANEL
jgi:hypothetical protein